MSDDEILEVFEIVQLGWTLTYATLGVCDAAGDVARRLPPIGRLHRGSAPAVHIEGELLRTFLGDRPEGRSLSPNALLDDHLLRAFDPDARLV